MTVCILLTLLSAVVYAANAIIVDVGSSGFRLYFYQYPAQENLSLKDIKLSAKTHVSPGLQYVSKDQLDHYLSLLFDQKSVLNKIPPALQQEAPVYFYATAGMRTLDPQKQKIVYDSVRHWLSTHTKFVQVDTRTITGPTRGSV